MKKQDIIPIIIAFFFLGAAMGFVIGIQLHINNANRLCEKAHNVYSCYQISVPDEEKK